MVDVDDGLLRDLWARRPVVLAKDIAKILGCCRERVSKRARQIGLPGRCIVQGTLPVRWIQQQYLAGLTSRQIQAELRKRGNLQTVSHSTILRLLKSIGVRLRPAAHKPGGRRRR